MLNLYSVQRLIARLFARDVKRENPINDEMEARELKARVERRLASSNIRFETPLERIRLMISGRKRIRFYNPLTIEMITWIYENPEALVVKRKTVGADASVKNPISIDVGAGFKHEMTEENRSTVNPEGLPITILSIPPTITVPVYVQSNEVYLTFGVNRYFEEGGKTSGETVILQHARLVPTSSLFTFRNYHLKHPIGVIREERDYPSRSFSYFYGKEDPMFWESEFAVSLGPR